MKLFFFAIAFAITFISHSQILNLWGANRYGGSLSGGVLYKTSPTGTGLMPVFNFDGAAAAASPIGNVVQAPNGRFYGTTMYGGVANKGTIFEYDPESGLLFKLHQFNFYENGQYPSADLIVADNGKIYGSAGDGGTDNYGILFELDIVTKTFTILINFDGPNNGATPIGNLLQASDGYIYGLTKSGGLNNHGTIFKIDPLTGSFTKLHDLNGPSSGREPLSGFCEAANGNLFTTTRFGGIHDAGTILEFNLSTASLTKEFDMVNSGTGYNPKGGLVLANDGMLYGISDGIGGGSIIRYNYIDSIFTKLMNLDILNHGDNSTGTFLKHTNGSLYMTCPDGGINGAGTIVTYNTSTGVLSKIYDFPASTDSEPCRNLTMGYDGKIYGNLHYSFSNSGKLFEFNVTSLSYNEIFQFGVPSINGRTPSGKLALGADNKIYGVTTEGGTFGHGCIYRYNASNGLYEQLWSFDGTNSGSQPKFGLVDGGNGKFYGTTFVGGANNLGVLFEFDPVSLIYTKLLDFDIISGSNPYGELMLADNGNLYGTLSNDGLFDDGTIFKFDLLSNTFTKVHDFTGGLGGSIPKGALIQADNGKIYGVTEAGGSGAGAIYEFDPVSEVFAMEFNLHYVLYGAVPQAGLIQASDGKLYGTTNAGGQELGENGTIFQYDFNTNTCVLEYSFGTGFYQVEGSFFESSDGNLYAPNNAAGGGGSWGGIFKFDESTGNVLPTAIATQNFSGYSSYSTLVEFNLCYPGYSLVESEFICAGTDYTAPDGTLFTNVTADFVHVSALTSILGCDSNVVSIVSLHNNDTSIFQNLTSLTSNQATGLFQWLDCSNGYSEIPGANFPTYTATTIGTFAVKLDNAGCEDTSACITIVPQDFYNLPEYFLLEGEVFAFPVTNIDTCDATALSFASGGVPPYHYDWYTQLYNYDSDVLDSLCEGFHTLKITDNIGDTVLVDYYVTDTANYYSWYDTTFVGFVDTVYIAAPNCLINYTIPLDSLEIITLNYLMPDTLPPGELYFIEIAYFQSGNTYIHQDTISIEEPGLYLINFSVFCPIKTNNSIKTILYGSSSFLEIHSEQTSQNSDVTVFPNPFRSSITINNIGSEELIYIYSLDGKLIHSQAPLSATEEIHLEHLESGSYILKIGESIVKIIKY